MNTPTTRRCKWLGHKWRLVPYATVITCARVGCDHARAVTPDVDVQAVSARMWERHGDSTPRPAHYRGSLQDTLSGYMEGPAPWNTPSIEEAAARFVDSARYSK